LPFRPPERDEWAELYGRYDPVFFDSTFFDSTFFDST
jgi:hypothetical protein